MLDHHCGCAPAKGEVGGGRTEERGGRGREGGVGEGGEEVRAREEVREDRGGGGRRGQEH